MAKNIFWIVLAMAVVQAGTRGSLLFAETKTDGIFKRIEISGASTFDAEKAALRSQAKLVLRDAEARVNGNFGAIDYDNPSLENAAATGGFVLNVPKSFPFSLSLKWGMNSASGLYSRLSNPVPANLSGAFSSAARAQNVMDVRLPSATSTKKPFATSVQFAFAKKNKMLSNFSLGVFVQDTNSSAFATGISFAPTKTIQTGINFVTARFYFGKSSSYWRNDYPLFPADWFWQSAVSAFLKTRRVSSVATVTLHESPTYGVDVTFYDKTTITLGAFIWNMSFFYGGKQQFVLSSGAVQKTAYQAHVNPQLRFPVSDKLLLGIGAAAMATIAMQTSKNMPLKDRLTMRYAGELALSGIKFRTNISALATVSDAKSVKISWAAAWSKMRVNPSVTFANTISEPASGKYKTAKQSVTLSAQTAPSKHSHIEFSANTTFTERLPTDDEAYLKNVLFSLSSTVSYKAKYLWVTGSVTAKFGIDSEE